MHVVQIINWTSTLVSSLVESKMDSTMVLSSLFRVFCEILEGDEQRWPAGRRARVERR